MYFCNDEYQAMLVGVPNRSWRYGQRAELRIRRIDDDRPLKGRGCYDGLVACVTDLDRRYTGPRSRLGMILENWGF